MNLNNKTQIIESSNYTRFFSFLSLSLFLLTLLSSLLLSSPSVLAENTANKNLQVTVPVSCNLSLTETTAHTASITPGTYVNNIGESNVKATCNDSNGFAIYAIGYSGDTYGNNTLINTTNSNYTIATGTATSGATSNWAMKLTSVTGTYEPIIVGSTGDLEKEQNTPDFSNYTSIPSTYTKVAYRNSSTDSITGANLKTSYAAYITSEQYVGEYEGKVKYTLVHPSTNDTNSFVVNFVANGGTGTMSSQKISRGVATALSANSFTAPSGLRFGGWNTAPDGSGTTYADSAQVTNLAAAGESVSLYAIWEEIPTQSSCPTSPMLSTVASGITYMQDINSTNSATVLSALTTDATYQIKDNRDNETYCVGKLADGKLWLLDNLALDLTNSTVLSGMNENNTHASNTTLNYLKNGGGTTSDKYAITGAVNWTDSPTYASSYSNSDPLVNLTDKDVVPTDTMSQAGQYKVGGYYNYCAASAGSYCYGNGISEGTSSGDATEDICPKGWRMPTGGSSGEYQALYNNASYNTYANYRSALRLPISGYIRSGSVIDRGIYSDWWSSRRDTNYGMSTPYADTSNIYPVGSSGRFHGYSVRCILGS